MMVAEGIEFFVDAVFAINDERLVLGNIVLLAEILEDRRHLGFKAVGQRLVGDVFVMIEPSREQVQGALTVARIDAGRRGDVHIAEQDAAFLVKLVIDERAMG